MSFDLNLAPFLAELALGVDEKSAALYAHEFSSIQHLFADHIELAAEFFVRIGQ